MKNFKRFFSTIQRNEKFNLVKFDQNSKGDYELFRNLIIDNMEFSALQFLIPNINQDVKDLRDKKALRLYFDNMSKEQYLRDAYNYATRNHDRGVLGYNKVMDGQEFIGNAGWMMHEVDNKGVIHKIERGIHLKQDLCSPDKPSNSPKPRIGAMVMKEVVQKFEDNIDHLNPDGELVSSILISNERSRAFTQKHKLNVGEPTFQQNGTNKWVQKIGDFSKRLPEIKGLLDESISEKKGR